jgi:hypothetical protein
MAECNPDRAEELAEKRGKEADLYWSGLTPGKGWNTVK